MMRICFLGSIFLIFFFSLINNSSLFSIPSTALPKRSYGVSNLDNSFIKQISKKFKLSEFERRFKVKDKKYCFKEYRNVQSHLIVSFQQEANKPMDNVLNNISILSSNKNLTMAVADFFIASLNADKNYKKRWNNYVKKVPFNKEPTKYFEYGGVPSLRCLTHKVYHPTHKKDIYLIEITISE